MQPSYNSSLCVCSQLHRSFRHFRLSSHALCRQTDQPMRVIPFTNKADNNAESAKKQKTMAAMLNTTTQKTRATDLLCHFHHYSVRCWLGGKLPELLKQSLAKFVSLCISFYPRVTWICLHEICIFRYKHEHHFIGTKYWDFQKFCTWNARYV